MTRTQEVWVNGRALLRRTTGVERYTTEVIHRLPKRAHTIIPPSLCRGWLGHFWEQLLLPLNLPRAALLWSPANSGPLILAHQVVTIHDLGPLEHPEWYRPRFARLYRSLLPRLIMRVKAVLVPSSHVKMGLQKHFPTCESKVFIVPEGVDGRHFYPRQPDEKGSLRRRYNLPDRFLLALGTLQPRKNLHNLLAAWLLLHSHQPELGLVIVGGGGPQFPVTSLKPMPAGVQFLGRLLDQELPVLYSSALGYVCASLDEGFGLTLLEAMACGTPVASSRSGALPELLDGAGLTFDPKDPQEIAMALERLATQPWLRSDLIEMGHARARCFNWEKTAATVWEILQDYA